MLLNYIRVALVHDWLLGMRGGERCLERIAEHEHEFERMRQKVDEVEAVAETQRELVEEFGQVKSKLEEEEMGMQVEQELSALQDKKKSK